MTPSHELAEATAEYVARKERIRRLRHELAAARAAGKAIRHANRLRRERAGEPTGRTRK